MVRSMTGFGYSEKDAKEYKITVEIKSVNHRYSDISIKLPKKFSAYENILRNQMKRYAGRGKVDVFITFESYADNEVCVKYHPEIAGGYVEAIRKAGKEFGIAEGLQAAHLIRYPEVVTLEDAAQDITSIYPDLDEVFAEAARSFLEARETEGSHLQKDIMEKLEQITQLVTAIEERSPQLVEEYSRKIMAKVEELLGKSEIDESTLATELVVYADKVCVDEETVRLRSHISNMKDTLSLNEPIGRKLDFIAQEMNREANTILSKANDKDVSNIAIDLKTGIEKIREQIQNIE